MEAATGRAVRGAVAYVEWVKGWMAAFPDRRVTFDRVVACAETVVAEITWSGTQTGALDGPFGTIPPPGKAGTRKTVQVTTVAGGKITEQHHYFDLLTLLRSLGALPGLELPDRAGRESPGGMRARACPAHGSARPPAGPAVELGVRPRMMHSPNGSARPLRVVCRRDRPGAGRSGRRYGIRRWMVALLAAGLLAASATPASADGYDAVLAVVANARNEAQCGALTYPVQRLSGGVHATFWTGRQCLISSM